MGQLNIFCMIVVFAVYLSLLVAILLKVFTKRFYFVDQRGPQYDRWIRVTKSGPWPETFAKQIKEQPDPYYRRNIYPWGSGCISERKISEDEMKRIVSQGAEVELNFLAKD